ncbi:hypothetical protein D3C72_1377560 [compost metagenome]
MQRAPAVAARQLLVKLARLRQQRLAGHGRHQGIGLRVEPIHLGPEGLQHLGAGNLFAMDGCG